MVKPSFWHLRVGSVFTILILEVLLLSLMVDTSAVLENDILTLVLAQTGLVLRWMIVSTCLFILLLSSGFKHRIHILVSQYSSFSAFGVFILHQLSFFILVCLTHLVFHKSGTEIIFSYLWIVTLWLTGLTCCLLIANTNSWKAFINREKASIVGATLSGAIVVALGLYFQLTWGITLLLFISIYFYKYIKRHQAFSVGLGFNN